MNERPTPPPTAMAIIQAEAFKLETTANALLDDPVGLRERRNRRQAWFALREHKDEKGRAIWSYDEIGSWFGVSHTAISEAYRYERGERQGHAGRAVRRTRVTRASEVGA